MAQDAGQDFGRANRLSIDEHDAEAGVERVLLGRKIACRGSLRSAQGEELLVLRHKTIREFRRRRVVVRRDATAQIEDDRIDLLPGKTAQSGVEFPELGLAQISRPQISDVAVDDLAIKRRWRRRGRGMRGQKHGAAAEASEHAIERGAIKLRAADRRLD